MNLNDMIRLLTMAGMVTILFDLAFSFATRRTTFGQYKGLKKVLVSTAFSLTLAIGYLNMATTLFENAFATLTF